MTSMGGGWRSCMRIWGGKRDARRRRRIRAHPSCFGYNDAMSAPTQIWNRIIVPQEGDLPPEVARYFLSLTFTKGDKERYAQLAGKEHFDLTPEEKSELDTLVAANTFLMLLQAKARLSLNRHQPAA